MRFLSVCSGIDAASVAWNPLGWRALAFSEVDANASTVLAHHYPSVPNLGDMTRFDEWDLEDVDLLCGGTPCQSFSSAGLRKGLDDPRGNLMLTFGAIAARWRPRWLVWENVPGVLSSNGGRDFGAFLGMLGQLGYGFAYRILDAQHYGLAQRRQRVFVVGRHGAWQPAAAVLFERDSLRWHPSTGALSESADARIVAPSLVTGNGGQGTGFIQRTKAIAEAHRGLSFSAYNLGADASPNSVCITASNAPLFFQASAGHAGNMRPSSAVAGTLTCMQGHSIMDQDVLRRMTPLECERLQGFPDGYTAVPTARKNQRLAYDGEYAEYMRRTYADLFASGRLEYVLPDSARYRVLGNSWAVPVAHWIGKRLLFVDGVLTRAHG